MKNILSSTHTFIKYILWDTERLIAIYFIQYNCLDYFQKHLNTTHSARFLFRFLQKFDEIPVTYNSFKNNPGVTNQNKLPNY